MNPNIVLDALMGCLSEYGANLLLSWVDVEILQFYYMSTRESCLYITVIDKSCDFLPSRHNIHTVDT